MGSCRCCVLVTVVFLVGMGIAGYFYRDQVIREYNKYFSPGSAGSYDDDSSEVMYGTTDDESSSEESSEETTTERVSSSTESSEDIDYQDTTTTTTDPPMGGPMGRPMGLPPMMGPMGIPMAPLYPTEEATTTTTPRIEIQASTTKKSTALKSEIDTFSGSGDIDSKYQKSKGNTKGTTDDEDYANYDDDDVEMGSGYTSNKR